MIKQFVCCLVVLVITNLPSIAQNNSKEINLEYLIKNSDSTNLQMQILSFNEKIREELIKDAKGDFYPTFSFLNSNNLGAGRYLDPFTNTYSTQTTYFNSLSLNSRLNIYKGGAISKQLHISKLNYEYELLQNKITRKSIFNEIAQGFFEILILQEEKDLIDSHLVLLRKEANIIENLAKSGRVPTYEKLEIENRISNILIEKERNIVNYNAGVDRIKFLTGITNVDSGRFVSPEFTILPDSNYETNASLQLDLQEISVKIAEQKIKLAKAARKPHIYISTSLVTGYTQGQTTVINDVSKVISPIDQFSNNINNVSILNIAIPIFSNRDIKTNINLAKIEHSKSMLNQEIIEQELLYLLSSRLNYLNLSIHSFEQIKNNVKDQELILSKYSDLFINGRISADVYLRKSEGLLENKKQLIKSKYELLYIQFQIENDFSDFYLVLK